jgi:hypothetical protein
VRCRSATARRGSSLLGKRKLRCGCASALRKKLRFGPGRKIAADLCTKAFDDAAGPGDGRFYWEFRIEAPGSPAGRWQTSERVGSAAAAEIGAITLRRR